MMDVELIRAEAEAEYGLPFIPAPYELPPLPPEPEPRPALDEGPDVDADSVAALMRAVEALEGDARLTFQGFARSVKDAKCSVDPRVRPSTRRFQIVRAMKAWAEVGDEELLRAGMALVLGDDAVQPAFATGALLAGLTFDQAASMCDLADVLSTGLLVAAYDDDGRCELRRVA